MSYEYKSGTQTLEERYITFDEVGLTGPNQTPSKLWSWGNNSYGNLGLNDRTDRSSPVQVGSLTDWKQVALGNRHCVAIKTDGSLWSWGQGNRSGFAGGWLGLNDKAHRSSPVQVGSLTDWKQVSVVQLSSGYYCGTIAVKTDGALWIWGYDTAGGYIVNSSSPVQVGTLTNWKKAVILQGSGSSALSAGAIKTDGTLWTWGNNDSGGLGQGDITHRNSPVQVGTLTNWKDIFAGYASMYAIKTDGTLWRWGYNAGVGISSPTQVGTATNWKKVAPLGGYGYCGLRTDGTLWSWGYNYFGQLGLGDTTNRTDPTQVGTLTNWKDVSGGGGFGSGAGSVAAVKTDGTLWAWGHNDTYNLGLGTTTNYSSPVQVGSLTNWKSAEKGGFTTIAQQLNS